MMCACHVERSGAKSKHLPKDTIPLGSACSEILRLRFNPLFAPPFVGGEQRSE